MNKARRWIGMGVLWLLMSVSVFGAGNEPPEFSWPAITKEARPWTYWWWLGSAVDKENLTRTLETYRKGGMGGVHLVCIYGVKGWEDRFINFLSPKWMKMLEHTTAEAKRLNMGFDMSTTTGWPMGGPQISPAEAAKKVIFKTYALRSGERLNQKIEAEGQLQALMAYSDQDKIVNLTKKVDKNGILDWTAPIGKWELYAVFQGWTKMMVKRSAPGGAGLVLDPFSAKAMRHYLKRFDMAFADYTGEMPRAFYHDSYEYFGADWTDDFFEQFKSRRGYDLRNYLPLLLGKGPDEIVARIKCDYRETIAELYLEEHIMTWINWGHKKGVLHRNMAHKSPGNLIDTYAAGDIPDTEIYGPQRDRLLAKGRYASSAAHLAGRKLLACEACTWIGEHFKVSLALVKSAIDLLFVGGVNHITYHGMTYSPAGEPWPGWLFYAGTHFDPRNTIWRDMPELNAYIARCQSVLQTGKPSNTVLLFYPIYDSWHNKNGRIMCFGGGEPIRGPQRKATEILVNRGFAFDFVSDKFLAGARNLADEIQIGNLTYQTLVVPKCRFITLKSLRKLVDLANGGATIVVHGSLPTDVPGFGNLENRQKELQKLLSGIKFSPTKHQGIRKAIVSTGSFLAGDDLEELLEVSGVVREPLVDKGLQFIRRTHTEGHHYFVANLGQEVLDDWVPLGVKAKSVVILDPRFSDKSGLAAIRQSKDGFPQVFLQLPPGQSWILRTFSSRRIAGPRWQYLVESNPEDGLPTVQLSDYDPSLPTYKSFPKGFTEIKGVTIKDVSTAYLGQEAEHMIDGSGLNSNGSHSRIQTTMWLSAQAAIAEQYVTFDLGSPSDVDAVMIWNYNENETRPVMDRGVKEMDILVSADDVTYKNLGRFTLKQAPGTHDVNYSQIFPLVAHNIRYVKFDIKTNRSHEGYVGLSEVRFSGKSLIPKPKKKPDKSIPRIVNAKGTWKVTFLEGGPTLPAGFETKTLASWTKLGDEEAKAFSGTARYTITFDKPSGDAEEWVLDLGRVCESARVRLNGKQIAALWSPPFRISVGHALHEGKNILEVEVTNLMANRIADMDRRKVNWKKFYNINMPSIKGGQLDASSWEPMNSGLLGPVQLIPCYTK